jgi:alcohol dehydrogenase
MGMVPVDASDETAAAKLVENLRELTRQLKVPMPAEFGIERRIWEANIDAMVHEAIASGSPANNPRVPSAEEIEELYHTIWG